MTVKKMRSVLKGVAFFTALFCAVGAVGPATTWVGMAVCVAVMVPSLAMFMRLEHLDKMDALKRAKRRIS